MGAAGRDEELSLSFSRSSHLTLMFPRCFWFAEFETGSSSIFPDIFQNFFDVTFTPNVGFWGNHAFQLKAKREKVTKN